MKSPHLPEYDLTQREVDLIDFFVNKTWWGEWSSTRIVERQSDLVASMHADHAVRDLLDKLRGVIGPPQDTTYSMYP